MLLVVFSVFSPVICPFLRGALSAFQVFLYAATLLLMKPFLFFLKKSASFNSQFEQQYLVYQLQLTYHNNSVGHNLYLISLQARESSFKSWWRYYYDFSQSFFLCVGPGTHLPSKLLNKTTFTFHMSKENHQNFSYTHKLNNLEPY